MVIGINQKFNLIKKAGLDNQARDFSLFFWKKSKEDLLKEQEAYKDYKNRPEKKTEASIIINWFKHSLFYLFYKEASILWTKMTTEMRYENVQNAAEFIRIYDRAVRDYGKDLNFFGMTQVGHRRHYRDWLCLVGEDHATWYAGGYMPFSEMIVSEQVDEDEDQPPSVRLHGWLFFVCVFCSFMYPFPDVNLPLEVFAFLFVLQAIAGFLTLFDQGLAAYPMYTIFKDFTTLHKAYNLELYTLVASVLFSFHAFGLEYQDPSYCFFDRHPQRLYEDMIRWEPIIVSNNLDKKVLGVQIDDPAAYSYMIIEKREALRLEAYEVSWQKFQQELASEHYVQGNVDLKRTIYTHHMQCNYYLFPQLNINRFPGSDWDAIGTVFGALGQLDAKYPQYNIHANITRKISHIIDARTSGKKRYNPHLRKWGVGETEFSYLPKSKALQKLINRGVADDALHFLYYHKFADVSPMFRNPWQSIYFEFSHLEWSWPWNPVYKYDAPEIFQCGFQDPSTPIMEGIIDLHHDLFFFFIVIGGLVFWVLFRTVYFFSWKGFVVPENFLRNITHHTTLEVVWTVIPALILVLIATPSFSLLYAMEDIIKPGLTIKVSGNQWYWSYEYFLYATESNKDVINFEALGAGGTLEKVFDSYMVDVDDLFFGELRLLEVDNRVIVPTLTHIRFLITSTDVLHSFAVPSLGIKLDACPGRLNQTTAFITRQGLFYGQCSEICGINHAFMPIVIEAVDTKTMLTWLQK